jgi:hypothetical protein
MFINLNNFLKGEGWMITNETSISQCSDCLFNSNKLMYWHEGGISGVTTFLGIIPKQELVIVVLTNLGMVNIAEPIGFIANKFP